MKCDRLISLVKNWYVKVQEEAMAPARMVAFIENHISQCEECLADPDVRQEADKIREIVLPPSKVPKPKAVRSPKGEAPAEEEEEEEETVEEDEDVEETDDEEDDDEEEEGEDFDPDMIEDEDI